MTPLHYDTPTTMTPQTGPDKNSHKNFLYLTSYYDTLPRYYDIEHLHQTHQSRHNERPEAQGIDFSLVQKKEIIDAAKKNPNQSELARQFSKNWGFEVKRTAVISVRSRSKQPLLREFQRSARSWRTPRTQGSMRQFWSGSSRREGRVYQSLAQTLCIMTPPVLWHFGPVPTGVIVRKFDCSKKLQESRKLGEK